MWPGCPFPLCPEKTNNSQMTSEPDKLDRPYPSHPVKTQHKRKKGKIRRGKKQNK